ncbi:MAG: cation diffusion facilitator family transporter [Legionella sp.]|nr:cation diffusion facilitator family transporter [Legionella sp.]
MTTDRYWQAKKVTLIGAVINAFLGFIKLIGGIWFNSHALVADGIHSFSDLVTDILVLFASKFGSQSADDTHPYGHQRFETAGTLLLALLLILAGFGIAWDALYELIYKTYDMPGWWALPIAILSIVANEILFHYTRHVGKKIQSALIIANAWHHRSDAASSVVVALGLLGSIAGFYYFDTVAAIIVGIMIIKMGLAYGWNSVKELVDTAVEEEVLTKIEHIIRQFDGVKKIHQLRTRLMGGNILIDVHILVDPYISVSEGHFIAQHVHHALIKQFKRIQDVIVHVDPEDDEENCPSLHLPSRKTLDKKLIQPWQEEFPCIHYWTLHYLESTMRIDLVCRNCKGQMKELKARIAADLLNFPDISDVRLFNEDKVIANEKALHKTIFKCE